MRPKSYAITQRRERLRAALFINSAYPPTHHYKRRQSAAERAWTDGLITLSAIIGGVVGFGLAALYARL